MYQRVIVGLLLVLSVACTSKRGGSGSGGSSGGGAGTGGSSTGGAGGTGTTGAGGTGTTGTGGTGTTGAGGTGTTGAGGTGTTGTGGTGTTGAGGSTTTTGNSVLERNNHPSRDGAYIQPTLTKAMVTKMATDTGFQATFTGSMRGSPLYLESGPNGKGAFYAATASNNVVALDETTGAVVWTKSVGAAPTANGVSCGDIHPIGIISTPVIDAQARTIFVAGAVGTSSIMNHQIHALSVDDGTERSGWPVDVSKVTSGSVAFTPTPQNQRSALSLVNGILYVAYGGHNGDCGTYHGWVVAVNSANPASVAGWATAGEGDAIWAAGGLASDGNGVFATTGDNHPRVTTHSDSEEVIRITGMAVADRSNQNLFYPTEWATMDNTDADLSANSPVYLQVPDSAGGTTRTYVVAITKDGSFYVLNSKNLGGIGGQVAKLTIASGGAMVVHTVPASYATASGVYVTFTTDSGAQCPTGMPSGTVVMSVMIPPGATPVPKVIWCASIAQAGASGETGAGSRLPASPMITTTDGKSEAMVWFMSGGKLTAVDGDSGKVLYTSSDTCTGVKQWTAPIAVKGRIVAGGDGHLCSWSLH